MKDWFEEDTELHNGGNLFDLHSIEDDIAAAREPRVDLPAGGHIVIEATEALTAIDVNSGRAASADNHGETILTTNLEAAREVARQLRLRSIGGLIVVDFSYVRRGRRRAGPGGWLVGDIRRDFATKMSAIENFASYQGLNSAGLRVIVIDEFDNMNPDIQRSLKGHLDRFSSFRLFIFTTNNLKKVDAGVRSRCERVHIGKTDPAAWLPRMRKILTAEKVPVPTNQHLANIAAASNGDCRELLNDLENFVIRYRAQPTLPQPTKPELKVLQGGKAKK